MGDTLKGFNRHFNNNDDNAITRKFEINDISVISLKNYNFTEPVFTLSLLVY